MSTNSDIVREILAHFPHRADANLRLIEPDAVTARAAEHLSRWWPVAA